MKPDDFSITVLTVFFFTLLAVVPVPAQTTSGSAAGTLPQLPPGQSLGIFLRYPDRAQLA